MCVAPAISMSSISPLSPHFLPLLARLSIIISGALLISHPLALSLSLTQVSEFVAIEAKRRAAWIERNFAAKDE